MAPLLSTLRHPSRWGPIAATATAAALLLRQIPVVDAAATATPAPKGSASAKAKGKAKRVAVNMEFVRQFRRIFRILVPHWLCKESGYMALVAAMMAARTVCDLWMIKNGVLIESAIIGRRRQDFVKYFGHFLLMMIPIALVNNLLKHGLRHMALGFRENLTNHAMEQYLRGFTFYKVSNLDNRVANPDQLIATDVERFATSVADLYSNLSKPLLDVLIYSNNLGSAVGYQAPATMLLYLVASGVFLTAIRRPLGRLTATEQHLEGEFRYVNTRIITNGEQVAFFRGNKKESEVIESRFGRLISHLKKGVRFRFTVGIVDTIVAKYCATLVAYFVISPPFLNLDHPRHLESTQAELTRDYYRSGRMLVNLAQAVGRLVLSGRELNRLAGFTARVTELLTVLQDLNNGTYERTVVKGDATVDDLDLVPYSGTIVEQDHVICFDDVPIVTPNKDVLIKSLNFEIKSGMNLLVVGPNGCGKSSLFRILGGLWPLFGGKVTKPAQNKLFYVPQRPYLTIGTLRDQIIYPHSYEQFRATGKTDDDLLDLLDIVQTRNLVTREGGWDTVQDWTEVLSGGEKQRIAMARLFYHRPQFAILDECTSAVSLDVEAILFNHSRDLGITLVTVSHRKSLWKYHEHMLRFDGRGAYEFRTLTDEERSG